MIRKIALGAITALLLAAGISGCSTTTTESAPAPATTTAAPAPLIPEYTTPAFTAPAPKPEDTATAGQKNALREARSYLNALPFSKVGLAEQLKYEKYSPEDVAWALDKLTDVDWNAQAVKDAKNYLDTMPFSRDGLLKQLLYEGYTPAEAEAGVTGAGL